MNPKRDVYMYQAALWCGTCGEKLRAELPLPEGADLEDEHTYDSDDYPKGPFPDGGGESDTPQHCDGCKVLLRHDLTDDGQRYVRETFREHILTGNGAPAVLDAWQEQWPDLTCYAPRGILGSRRANGALPAYAWPGGYPVFYQTRTGDTLCPGCATNDIDNVVAGGVNWEDPTLHCDECSERIESAYAEDGAEGGDDKA